MPIILPKSLPAAKILESENVFVMNTSRAVMQDIRPLRIVIVNLMPTKVDTETQLARVLANSPLQVELTFLHMSSHKAANTSALHLDAFYKTFDEIANDHFDGMLITGAPVETLPFEAVDYWQELCCVMEYSKANVYSTMHLCWGAQAALYHHYGVGKAALDTKMFGVFPTDVLQPQCPLVRGFDDSFFAPASRYTQVDEAALLSCKNIQTLCSSKEAGLYLAMTKDGRQVFVTGHPEYDAYTLDTEYRRDLAKGLAPSPPCHYYEDNNADKPPLFRWRSHAHLLYSNWLNYYVYQNTPYEW